MTGVPPYSVGTLPGTTATIYHHTEPVGKMNNPMVAWLVAELLNEQHALNHPDTHQPHTVLIVNPHITGLILQYQQMTENPPDDADPDTITEHHDIATGIARALADALVEVTP